MRTEVEHHSLVATAKNPRVGESRHAGTNLDGAASGVIENTVLEGPAVGVPGPAGDGSVDEGGPEEDEDHAGNDSAALGGGTSSEGGSNGAEHHLVEGVEKGGNERRALGGSSENLHEAEVSEITNEAVGGSFAKGKRVTPEVPLEDDD